MAPTTPTFLNLPLEIRLEIYDRVLACHSNEEITLGTIPCSKPEPNSHRLPQLQEARVCPGRSEPLLFDNITALPLTDPQSTQTEEEKADDLQWSPFVLLETCTQVRTELATHLRLRWRARLPLVKKLWVSYPYGTVLLDGIYAPLINVTEEIVAVGYHSVESEDIQKAAIRGLENCVRAFEKSMVKSITNRIYFPGQQQEAYLRSVSGPYSPVNTLLGVTTEDVKLDMGVWRGKCGVAWVIDLRRRDLTAMIQSKTKESGEGDAYTWYEDQGIVKETEVDHSEQESEEDEGYASAATTPGGRHVIMRWPSWWEGERWICVLKGEGKEFGTW